MLKIFTVSFNDGGWHTNLPKYTIVAENNKDAIDKALEKYPQYKNGWDSWASEFKVDGYVIEVYDEKAYERDRKFKKLDDGKKD